jgi:hypothetical protein
MKKDKPDIPALPKSNIPAWAFSAYDGDVDEMTNDIQSAIFWGEVPKLTYMDKNGEIHSKPKDLPVEKWYQEVIKNQPEVADQQLINARLSANTFTSAVEITGKLMGKAERGLMLFLYESKKNKRYMNTQHEYETFEEFLLDKLPYLMDKPGEKSNVMFLLTQMLPLVSQLGIDGQAAAVFGSEGNYTKVRECVPFMRKATVRFEQASQAYDEEIQESEKKISRKSEKLMRMKPDDPERKIIHEEIQSLNKHLTMIKEDQEIVKKNASLELKESMGMMLEAIADPSIPSHGPNGIGKILFRSGDKVSFTGAMSLIPKKTAFYFVVPVEYQGAVESAMASFMKFRTVGGNEIIKYAERDLKNKEKE